jgi:FMN phosphatase YigB (HAD superfamily)
VEVLEDLSTKYTLAIVALATAGERKIQERLKMIKANNLEKYFTSILFDVKNKDSLYVKTLEDLSIKPEEVIIIDDRVVRGIKWGNEEGATTIWFQNGKFKNELPDNKTGEPTYTVHSLSEISEII